MAEPRDPTLAPGTAAPPNRDPAAPPRRTGMDPTPAPRGGMSRWIWIVAAAVVAIVVLMMLFGGAGDEAATPGADDPAATTAPADPAAPAAPAPTD